MFVNSLGLPFFAGTIFFFGLVVALAIFFIKRARKTGNHLLYNITFGLVLLLIGYGSFAVIVIRSNANPPLDENDPENLVTLHAYLKREQYGSAPVASGQFWNSKKNDGKLFKDQSPFYLRRWVVSKGNVDIKAFQKEEDARAFAKSEKFSDVTEKYFESNKGLRENTIATYAQTTLFPRMYWSDNSQGKVSQYKYWSGYDPSVDVGTELGEDGQRLPSQGENMTYFGRYQVNWMYFRYFLWNFAGRQNDIQGHGSQMSGNWLSGFSFIDNVRLGNQDVHAPYFTSENPSNNKFFFLPLILGLIGLIFHFYRAPKDAFVVTMVFLFTGLAIVIYLNQKPFEPRERDYAYAGSFYFFAMWIGIGVLALYEAFKNFGKEEYKKTGIVVGTGFVFAAALDASSVGYPNLMSWLMISLIGVGALGLMTLLKKVLQGEKQGAIVATVLALTAPLVMGVQGWDDHDRSDKTSAHNLAYNYLNSCGSNGIIFTNGDNDTFPLWYLQEVEGVRTDVRVCNLSLMQTDWYTNQMKMQAYESKPMPIEFREDQILMSAGKTDQVIFMDILDMLYRGLNKKTVLNIINMRLENNRTEALRAVQNFNGQMATMVGNFTIGTGTSQERLELLKRTLVGMPSSDLTENIYAKFTAGFQVFQGLRSGGIRVPGQAQAEQFQKLLNGLEDGWNSIDLKTAMSFVKDDNNIVPNEARSFRIFPSKGFTLPVNIDNAIKSELVSEKDRNKCRNEVKFVFTAYGLQKQEVMMLDAIANNDWARGVYFAAPGGSDVSMALYRGGALAQNGLAYELTPLVMGRQPVNFDRMYSKLMKEFHYGEMNKEGVLTDYYTRRHTKQYRQHFESLAEGYLELAEEAQSIKARGEGFIDLLRQQNRMQEANRTMEIFNNADKVIKESKERAIKLIEKSLLEMPPSLVIDCSEPGPSNDVYEVNGQQARGFTDGFLHNYVNILFRAGETKRANELGLEVAGQLESIVDYFLYSNPDVTITADNTKHLFAATDSYFKMMIDATEPGTGDANGALAKRTKENLTKWFKSDLPAVYEQLKQMAIENGESIRSSSSDARYANKLRLVKTQMDLMAAHYGLNLGQAPSSIEGL